MNSPPEPAIIDLGPEPPGPDVPRRWSPHVARALGALGGVALFASLVGEWATTTYRWNELGETYTGGVESTGALGTGWVVGALAVTASLGLSLFGPAQVRVTARAIGLAVSGALAGLLVASSVVVNRYGAMSSVYRQMEQMEVEVVLGRGLYVGFAALVLLAAALWLARPPRPTHPATGSPAEPSEPAGPAAAGPGEVTVAPAEPVAYPDQRHEWR